MELLEKWSPIIELLSCDKSKHLLLAEYGEKLSKENVSTDDIARNFKVFEKIKTHKNLEITLFETSDNVKIEEKTLVIILDTSSSIVGMSEEQIEHICVKYLVDDINNKINESLVNSNGSNVKLKIQNLWSSIKLVQDVGESRALLNVQYEIESNYLKELLLLEKNAYENNKVKDAMVHFKRNITRQVLEESKEHYWLRLYLREELENIEKGETVRLRYAPNDEILEMTFVCYEKKGQTDQHFSDIIGYIKEDDKRTLCLMVDVLHINKGENINMLRRLFKCSHFYEEVILRREDLLFEKMVEDVWVPLEYFDADF